jgi:putative endonuclease
MQLTEGYHTYYIYIIINKSKTVFYTGVTNNLRIRLDHIKKTLLKKIKVLLQNTKLSFCCIMKSLPGFKKQLVVKKK